ncbi:MAG: hypothetical protein V1922_01120 [bacterium]
MTNFRQLPKNGLIGKLKESNKAIKLKCFSCLGKVRKQDCDSPSCALFSLRPWASKEIQVPLIAKK